jgi:lycopene beta-cyclase
MNPQKPRQAETELPDKNHFDSIIIGGGLSGLVAADKILGSLEKDQRVLVIDPHANSLEDKTFAYWIKKTAPPHPYSNVVANRWEKLRIISSTGEVLHQELKDYRYERIAGKDLCDFINKKRAGDPRFFRLNVGVRSVDDSRKDSQGKPQALVQLESGLELTAGRVFSSPLKPTACVLQSFLGFEIETANEAFESDTVNLMDFRVPQNGEVRFFYTLPFSSRRALIEYTVFSSQSLVSEEAEFFLRQHIEKTLQIQPYSILKRELGVIPMTLDSEPLFTPSFGSRTCEVIGGAAGRIKPSSGYSFLRNLETVFGSPRHGAVMWEYSKLRFRFYDSLMLEIIRKKGESVCQIFWSLFKKNDINSVFQFLDEKSNIGQEIRIFSKLPWAPFIVSWIGREPFFFVVILTLLFKGIGSGLAVWFFPVLGLLTFGIAHGSLDHVISSDSNPRGLFWLKYGGSMILFLLIWWVAPVIALTLFILQSALHFGESYWIGTLKRSQNNRTVRWLVAIWGLFAALFGVLFHGSDSWPIVQAIVRAQNDVSFLSLDQARGLSFVLLALAAGAAAVLDREQKRMTGRGGQGLPATLFLGASFIALPLLPGFFCFFAFWHSFESVQIQRMKTGWSATQYFKKAWPLTLVTLLGMAVLIFLFANTTKLELVWKVIFILISCLTAAHAPVMTRFLFNESEKVPEQKN